jgi:hypothetical protein
MPLAYRNRPYEYIRHLHKTGRTERTSNCTKAPTNDHGGHLKWSRMQLVDSKTQYIHNTTIRPRSYIKTARKHVVQPTHASHASIGADKIPRMHASDMSIGIPSRTKRNSKCRRVTANDTESNRNGPGCNSHTVKNHMDTKHNDTTSANSRSRTENTRRLQRIQARDCCTFTTFVWVGGRLRADAPCLGRLRADSRGLGGWRSARGLALFGWVGGRVKA